MRKPTILIVTALASLVVVSFFAVALGADRMVSPEFLATSLVVVLLPGTGVVYTVSSAMAGGRSRGVIAAVGCTLGIVPHMVAAMLGLSGVMQAGAAAFEVVRWVGVVYLVYMGVSMIRNGGALQFDDEDSNEPTDTSLTIIRRGVLLNLLNPKLTVFFFAFLPQFLDTAPRLLDPRLVILGAIFMAITLIVFLGYAYASAAVRDQVLQSPRVMQWVQRSLGTLLIGFAARLAVADR
jgi:threonine/homoserine/homoserine lactone efflux protein